VTPQEHEDELRHTPVGEYLRIQAGSGIKDFLRSNLFVFLLAQIVAFVSLIVHYSIKFASFEEFKQKTEITLSRMDDAGTHYSHNKIEEVQKDVTSNGVRIKAIEDDTKHLDVLEEEHRRLTNDVEKLKDKDQQRK